MKYIKIAILSILGVSCLSACQKENTNFGPGTGVVEFAETSLSVKESSSLFTLPLVLSGEPGGYPVTVNITAETDGDINDILLITSTTIKITDANNSYVQMQPVFNREENISHEVRLTIESCNGASIGTNNSCTIFINNAAAVHSGQYTVYCPSGTPDEWTILLQDGPDGTYIAGNLFNLEYSPQLIGTFDEETSQLIFDGRLYGQGESNLFSYPYGMAGEYYLYLISGSNGDDPFIINVDENMYLSSTNNALAFYRLVVDGQYLSIYDNPGLIQGNTTFEYAGAAIEEEWPF